MSATTDPHAHAEPRRRAPIRFPRLPLFGALGFVAFAAVATVFGQQTGIGVVKLDAGTPVAIRDIVLSQGGDAVITVTDAATGETIAAFEDGEGGFVRGSLRGLDRIRMIAGVPQDQPYRIIEWAGGAVSLSDTGTGERLYLDAFGPDNVAAFAAFLGPHETPERTPQ